jgi:hypothetical protein
MKSIASGVHGDASWTAKMAGPLAVILVAFALVIFAILSSPARAGEGPGAGASGKAAPEKTRAPAQAMRAAQPRSRRSSPYHAVSVPDRARAYYLSVWGVDSLIAHETASGSLIRFSYRVVDPARAKLLGDKRATPYMYGQRSHALLHIPVMEQVGPLRQSTPPKAGREYWMVFSNKGNFVQVGDRVNVIIGSVHVDGLLVE